ncbi:hypothetical protein AVEN_172117-1 [Araneus ventricosus]|uniref:Uncharacterized protein n=1 Tax=Araneus ventricosus TaxID=182803 RepID=A0A4Y2U1Q3_ARAVE|nr:hypothetical protein AVEN_172117-1 [Araneus ventricosus]
MQPSTAPYFDLSYDQAYSTIVRSARKFIRKAQEIDAKGKIWESLLHDPVPMELPRLIFTANFRILNGHDYLQGHLHRIGVKENPNCPLCSTGEIMNFRHLTVCATLANTNLNILPPDNYYSKASLYSAIRREMVNTT